MENMYVEGIRVNMRHTDVEVPVDSESVYTVHWHTFYKHQCALTVTLYRKTCDLSWSNSSVQLVV